MENLLPVIELFKKSFDNYWKKVWTLAGTVLFGMIGVVVLLPFVLVAFLISWQPFSNQDFNITLILVDVLLGLIGIFFVILFGIWSKVALTENICNNVDGITNSLKVSWPKLASFFWISLLVGLATLGGLILFVIPGIVFAVWFVFAVYIFIKEDVRGTEALKKSKELVKDYWWPVFGRIVVIAIIMILISWIKGLGPILNAFFAGPFSVVYMYELYQDLKRVKKA